MGVRGAAGTQIRLAAGVAHEDLVPAFAAHAEDLVERHPRLVVRYPCPAAVAPRNPRDRRTQPAAHVVGRTEDLVREHRDIAPREQGVAIDAGEGVGEQGDVAPRAQPRACGEEVPHPPTLRPKRGLVLRRLPRREELRLDDDELAAEHQHEVRRVAAIDGVGTGLAGRERMPVMLRRSGGRGSTPPPVATPRPVRPTVSRRIRRAGESG